MRSRSVSLVLWVFACGSPHHGPDAGAPDAFEPDAAQLPLGPLMPQDVAGTPTAVMAHPTVVAITYDGDANRSDVEALFQQYAASPAWALHVSEYGVGALTVGTPQHLTG